MKDPSLGAKNINGKRQKDSRMRLQFTLEPSNRKPLGFNYQYKLAGLVYHLLALGNENLAAKYHKSTDFKFFTFSWLYGSRKTGKEGIQFTGPVKWFVSSPVAEFMEAILAGALQKPELEIDKVKFLLTEAKVLEEPEFDGQPVKLKTLSPVLVKTKREGKKNPHWDLSPKDAQFYVNLQKNLVKKYKQMYGKEPDDARLNILEVGSPVSKRIKIKEEFHKGWMMEFAVEGSPELLKLGYQAGFGEKNSMGFGMVVAERWDL